MVEYVLTKILAARCNLNVVNLGTEIVLVYPVLDIPILLVSLVTHSGGPGLPH